MWDGISSCVKRMSDSRMPLSLDAAHSFFAALSNPMVAPSISMEPTQSGIWASSQSRLTSSGTGASSLGSHGHNAADLARLTSRLLSSLTPFQRFGGARGSEHESQGLRK